VAEPEVGTRVGVVVPNGFPGVPTYRLPVGMETPRPGARVVVPFGNRVVTGIAVEGEPAPLPGGGEREVLAVLDDEPFLPLPLLSVLLRAATYYFVPPGELLRAAVPGRLLSLGESMYQPAREMVGRNPADPRAREVLSAVVAKGRATLAGLAEDLGPAGLARSLRWLLDEGFVRVAAESVRPKSSPVERAWIARPHEETEALLARKPKQLALHRHLSALGRPAAAAELRAAGFSPALLSSLAKEGLVSVVESERRADLTVHAGPAWAGSRIVPTPEQRAAVEAIGAAVRTGREMSFLLDGVTGSGKTEVYLGAAEAAREEGKQSILLIPEIALAPLLVRRVLARFGDRVSLLHSGLSDGERAAEWERARRGDVDVVVGPRSAVFAPLPRLGLIVVDEAHDGSYKQGESPRYDARTLARVRARQEEVVLVLGSATPSMELERGAREGRIPRLVLPARPGARPPAFVEVVDLRDEPARPGDHGRVLFATRTVEILRAAFDRGEQGIVLLNRRGFSPSLLCRSCGHDFRCARCSVARTYHRRGERLLCHYCGEAIPRPARCPACASETLMPIGFGTERLAERFEELFPKVRYSVLDRDAAARRGGAAGILLDFEEGRSQALLGTQMVAKGHDFPGATALAVLDADALLSFPDFRSAERTFQLVTQAAGRVGRGEKPGLVAVQTSRPDHPAIAAAVRQDPAAFADAELRFRRTFRYPPFTHLLLALWADADAATAFRAATEGSAAVSSSPIAGSVRLLGPAPAPLERLKGLSRVQLLIRSESREALAAAGAVLSSLEVPPRLDVDPQNLL
jgi:primosomal protein N' (replication factor Y)